MNKMNHKGRMFLRVASVFLAFIWILSLTACQSKEPITAEIFQDKFELEGYTVIDISEGYAAYPHILEALMCEDDSVHVEFFEIDTNDHATGVFNGNKAQVEAYKGISSIESSVSTNNYQKYTLKTGTDYYLVERVGSTLIYAYSDKAEEEKLNHLIKGLGY